ncbi:MAG: hypothetical protein JRH11_21690 [Deltaproteobacteria bacterium]|nr:hypothetical protein [Deltaproteobacteria bacterium]
MAKPRKRTGAAKKVTRKVTKKVTKRAAKKPAKTAAKKPTKAAAKKPTKAAAKKPAKAAAKKPTKAAAKKPTKAAAKKPNSASPATKAPANKRAKAPKKTVPGGTAPIVDEVTSARRHLRQVREIIERVNDRDAELIVGDGTLEALLSAIVPRPGRSQHSAYEHLLAHKERASLLARIRHGINDRSAFAVEDGKDFVSPTRVQWFYDGLTFVEGAAPYSGVVGLYRGGVIRYGLAVVDSERDEYLGPLASDFVSVDEAKKSFRGASVKADAGLAQFSELEAKEPAANAANAARATAWATLLMDHPWMLGGQHTAITRLSDPPMGGDAELPEVVAKRAADGAHDILLIEDPSTPLVGKTGKVLASFREIWSKAERLRTFVQRQSTYLQREMRLKIRDPRFIIIAGRGLTDADRTVVRREFEVHHAAVRLVTYDALRNLAERTLTFFEPRI